MIRILQVFTVMDRGGAESMIMNYYRQINRTQVQFDFLVHRSKNAAFDKEIREMGGVIYKLPPINPLYPHPYYKRLREFFKEHSEYRIIHSHLNTFSKYPLKIAKENKIPIRIAHAHIAIEPISYKLFIRSKEGLLEGLKKTLKSYIRKDLYKYTTHQMACGEKAGNWLFGSKHNYALLNNAISSNVFIFDEKKRRNMRSTLNLDDQLILGHVGRFSSQKNHFFLLQIISDLLKYKSNIKLLLVGDGPLKTKIQEEIKRLKIENYVELLGVREDIPDILQIMDVFVFPSFYEGLPVTLIEAQAAGLKVIASDTITSEVKLTKNLKFLPISDTKQWVDEILSTNLENRENEYNNIVKGGYDIKVNADYLQNFYLQN